MGNEVKYAQHLQKRMDRVGRQRLVRCTKALRLLGSNVRSSPSLAARRTYPPGGELKIPACLSQVKTQLHPELVKCETVLMEKGTVPVASDPPFYLGWVNIKRPRFSRLARALSIHSPRNCPATGKRYLP